MGKASRRKGAEGELEVAAAWRAVYPQAARRGLLQAQRGSGAADVDLGAGAAFHLEVKRQKVPNVRAALRQAIADAPADKYPVAVTRADRDEWLVTMRQSDFLEILAELVELKRR